MGEGTGVEFDIKSKNQINPTVMPPFSKNAILGIFGKERARPRKDQMWPATPFREGEKGGALVLLAPTGGGKNLSVCSSIIH
jgi:hypothetical protein